MSVITGRTDDAEMVVPPTYRYLGLVGSHEAREESSFLWRQ